MSKNFTFDDFLDFIEEDSKHLVSKRKGLDSDIEKATYARVTKLMEECGELAEAILHHFGRQRSSKDGSDASVEHEMADVIITICLIAQQLDINIVEALESKSKKIKKRWVTTDLHDH